MPTIAKIANGTLLKLGDGMSPEVFTTVPEVSKLSGGSIKFDLLDATTHDSTGFFREFIPGLADGDVVPATVNFRPSNTVHQDVRDAGYGRELRHWKIVYPDTTMNTVDFSAYVQSFLPKADIGTLLMADISLKITGQPTWS